MSILMFFVNGTKVIDKNADPEATLLAYLRNQLRLTGSKLGCGEGGCGSCTVMVSKWDARSNRVRHIAVNACLAPLISVHECAVTTVEGIGSTRTKLHQVQERLARFHGSQCGFCTPGIVMSMYALLRNKRVPASKDIDTYLQGNLCRCTGYRPIMSAFQTFTCGMGDRCCKLSPNQGAKEDRSKEDDADLWEQYDASQEIIFPPELAELEKKKMSANSLTFVGEFVTWHQPVSLQEMLTLKSRYPEARIVVGNTEVGIEMNIKGMTYSHLISPRNISELLVLTSDEKGVTIGAACTLSDVEDFLQKICEEKPAEETQILISILNTLQLFAGVQIRNVACIGGNIMTASPISDLNPILLVCRATLRFASLDSAVKDVVMDDNFFTGYRKTNVSSKQVLLSFSIPFLTKNDVMCAYKQSKRKDDDIAIVNAAMLVNFEPASKVVRSLSIAYGGMDAITKIPKDTMLKAAERPWDAAFLEDACQWLSEEMALPLNAPGGMTHYRRTLAISFFFKFYHHAYATLVQRGAVEDNNVKLSRSISESLTGEDEPYSSEQTWQEVSTDQRANDLIGRPTQHVSGLKHATGEAEYLDDMPPYKDELHMALVYSTRAHAKLLSVDASKAVSSSGVVDYIDIRDVPGDNIVLEDDDVFADGKVTCVGHVIGAICADTHEQALKAARLVEVKYEDIQPKIITIEDAIANESFYNCKKMVKGDIEQGFNKSDYTLEGQIRFGGQEHFYMETQACIAIPRNREGEMEIWSSSQDPTALQLMASKCLGIPSHKIVAKTKRMGGGFGGKQTKFAKISNPAAVAARKLGKPIRCVLTRQDDMQITGGRNPFLGRYKVGFTRNGRIMALKMSFYNNAGNTTDLSTHVMKKAMLQTDNAYSIPNAEVFGYVCRTNVVSNTAFRGFGNPQATLFAEDWISGVADFLKMDAEKIREINLLKDNDTLIYGASAKGLLIRRCWDECMRRSQFPVAKRKVETFNKANRWKKRGIACTPAKYSIGFGEQVFNQAGALVLIYKDGTVLLSHGGSEMGQGLHTKTIQVASRTLGISTDLIHVMETSTATVPNATATAASVGSDLNGMAVKAACEKIVKRLLPLKKNNPDLPWQELVKKAYIERISLSATGYYRAPDLDFTWDCTDGKVLGDFADYRTSGCAVSEVEIDVLTGHHVVLKTELVMDIGKSLNPAIDIGQIEGAFAQGYGLVTIEEPLHSPSGQLLTVGPGAYKIPGFSDTPKVFNIHLLPDSENEKAIYSSKAVGEPPLLLAISVFCAIKEAIKAARSDAKIYGPLRLDSPATAERIRLACEDKFTTLAKQKEDDSSNLPPWSIRT